MRFSKYFILLFIVSLFSFACSELQNDIVTPSKVSVHGANVMLKTAPSFHGKVLTNNNFDGCKTCHASNLKGGTAKVDCTTSNCHPGIPVHTANIMNPTSNQFHGKFIENDNWSMSKCTQCHGDNYNGGLVSPTCYSCHKNPGGPEACNTCHGDFSNVLLIAPPRSLSNAIATTDASVGAHTNHLRNTKVGATVACNECHVIPSSLNSAGHLDGIPKAEVKFGTLSNTGNVLGTYNSSTSTCSNTYCHGNFNFTKAGSTYPFAYTADKMSGNNFTPQWNKVDGTQAKCGSCHGLPPVGHMASELKACVTCHQGIVDSRGNIVDATKHINGKINVFGN